MVLIVSSKYNEYEESKNLYWLMKINFNVICTNPIKYKAASMSILDVT